MTRIRNTLIAALLFFCTTSVPLHAQMSRQDSINRAVRTVVEKFSRALAAGDSIGALALLHPDVVIYEGGHAETKEQYRSGHVRSDIEFSAAVARKIVKDDMIVWPDVAMYTSTYTSTGRFRNRDINSSGTETIVLVRMTDGWKIRHIHWS